MNAVSFAPRPTQAPGSGRRALLIVRAGDQSLHPGWLTGGGAEARAFDLHVSYFGKQADPYPDRPSDVTLSFDPGFKFTGLADCLDKLGDRVAAYDWVGFPDDDLKADCAVWNRLFHVLDELQPCLAQPALSRRSFYSYDLTLRRPGLKARWTDFVEVMAPVFRRDFLPDATAAFRVNLSGWGLDHLWPRLADARGEGLCIVDAAPVLHTRKPGSGALYRRIGGEGVSAADELAAFAEAHDAPVKKPQTLWALTEDGAVLRDHARLNRRLRLPRLLSKLRRSLKVTSIAG